MQKVYDKALSFTYEPSKWTLKLMQKYLKIFKNEWMCVTYV